MVMYNVDSTIERSSKPVKECNFCHHEPGLAVLPVRYAVVGPEDKNGAPPLSGNFKIENAPAQLGSGVQYILRTMRPGFLYVFHEAMQMWDAYVVMKGGHLWKVIPENPGPAKVPEAFNCSVSPHHSLESLYFTIPDPAHATRVWYAYSHVAWTKAQLNDNKLKVEVRRAHMQCLDVAAWMGNQNQPHAARATEINKRVTSFSMKPEAQQQAFRHLSATPPRTINLGEIAPIGPISGSMLADRMEQMSPGKALMLACNDPLAIIEDLSILTNPKMHPKANNAVIWDQSTDFLLDRLEANIRASAEAQHTNEAEAAAAEAERMKTTPDGFPAYELMSVLFNGKATAERWKREDAEREATRLARKKAASDAAWAPYEAVLDKSRRHQDLTPRLKALNENVIAPISLSHAQWLMSPQLAAYMQYRHDKMELPHGYHYNEALTRCLEHGMQNAECRNVIKRWYEEANPAKDSNLLSRALLLNHQPIIDTVADPVDQGIGAVFAVFKSGIDAIEASAKGLSLPEAIAKLGLVPRLAWILSDEIIPALATRMGTMTARVFVIGLGLFGGARLVMHKRNFVDLRATVLSDLERINPALYKQLGRSVRREEAAALARSSKRLAQTAKVIWFDPNDLAHNTELSALRLRTERDVPGARQVTAALGSRFVNIGAVACILQGLALYHATQSFRAAGEFDEVEKGTKLAGGLVAMVGTLAEQTGIALDKAATHPYVSRLSRLMERAEWTSKGEIWAARGRYIGLAGAIVGVGWDGYHAYDEFTKGNRVLFVLYSASALSGGTAALISAELIFVGTPVWPLLVVLFAVNVGIAILDDPATLKWATRCHFSKQANGERYTTMEKEWAEFLQLDIKVSEDAKK